MDVALVVLGNDGKLAAGGVFALAIAQLHRIEAGALQQRTRVLCLDALRAHAIPLGQATPVPPRPQ